MFTLTLVFTNTHGPRYRVVISRDLRTVITVMEAKPTYATWKKDKKERQASSQQRLEGTSAQPKSEKKREKADQKMPGAFGQTLQIMTA
jgi:hypothetical protein